MFSLNGTLKKSGSVGRWEMKQFIGMAKAKNRYCPEKIGMVSRYMFEQGGLNSCPAMYCFQTSKFKKFLEILNF